MMKRIAAVLLAALLLASAVPVSAKSAATSDRIPDGAYGLWEVGCLKTSSVLYKGNISTAADQRIVDREDSACWRTYGKGHAIYDHAGSEAGGGVWNVEDMTVGGIATLTTRKGTDYYLCTQISLCTQTKYVMRYDGVTYPCKKGDVLCVSCADEDKQVYVAYYKKIA